MSIGAMFVPLFGITQNPHTLNYMIVMSHYELGNLRDNLLVKKYNPNDKFENLFGISIQLNVIHELGLIHGNLHGGKILLSNHMICSIGDLGLCQPVNQPNIKNYRYGMLPYIAPEVLRGKPYTKAADIYSFGIIMWKMDSCIQ